MLKFYHKVEWQRPEGQKGLKLAFKYGKIKAKYFLNSK